MPLGLRLIDDPASSRPLAAARWLQPWAALAVVGSFLARRGPSAVALAVPWVLVTLLVALHGWHRFRRGARPAAELAIDAGCLMLPIGGGWLVLSRLGATPLGFEEPIVLLTAVHFHYAAFATLVLTGLAGRVAGEGRLFRLIAVGAISGPPLLAAGITLSPLLELVAATILVLALSGLSALTVVSVAPRLGGMARVLLTLSSASVLVGMAGALAYAVGQFTDVAIISLGQMARIHGPLNALGFVLCGLFGWALAPRSFTWRRNESVAPIELGGLSGPPKPRAENPVRKGGGKR